MRLNNNEHAHGHHKPDSENGVRTLVTISHQYWSVLDLRIPDFLLGFFNKQRLDSEQHFALAFEPAGRTVGSIYTSSTNPCTFLAPVSE